MKSYNQERPHDALNGLRPVQHYGVKSSSAENCCEYCRIAQADIFFAFEADHVIAEKHGGPTHSDNLCLSCPDCNAHKGSDVASVDWQNAGAIVPLYHPHRHIWDDHFRWESNGIIESHSATGCVTISFINPKLLF